MPAGHIASISRCMRRCLMSWRNPGEHQLSGSSTPRRAAGPMRPADLAVAPLQSLSSRGAPWSLVTPSLPPSPQGGKEVGVQRFAFEAIWGCSLKERHLCAFSFLGPVCESADGRMWSGGRSECIMTAMQSAWIVGAKFLCSLQSVNLFPHPNAESCHTQLC